MKSNGAATIRPASFPNRFLLYAIFVILSLVGIHSASARSSPPQEPRRALNLGEYEAELDEWVTSLRRLQDEPEAAPNLFQDLPANWHVVSNGQDFEVSTIWLRDSLKSVSKNPKLRADQIKMTISRLNSMRREAEELEHANASAEITNAQAKSTLDAILARREFSAVHGPTWLDMLRERINQWLDDLFERFGRRFGNYPSLTVIIFWATIAFAACTLVVWMVRLLLRPAESVRLDLGKFALAPSSWRRCLEDAGNAAARGDYREAIRSAYWVCIYRLEELGIWKVDQARTHREYLRLVSPAQPQWAPLSVVTRQFEFAWYAGNPSSELDFEATLAQLEALGCAVRSTRPTARLSS